MSRSAACGALAIFSAWRLSDDIDHQDAGACPQRGCIGILTDRFGRELRPSLPFSLPYTGPTGFSLLNTLDQKSSFCLAVVRRGTSELVMMIGGAQVRFGQIAKSFVLRNVF